jgi:hypothetical protein
MASGEEFNVTPHKEMISAWDEGHPHYPDLIACIHVSKMAHYSINIYNYYVN